MFFLGQGFESESESDQYDPRWLVGWSISRSVRRSVCCNFLLKRQYIDTYLINCDCRLLSANLMLHFCTSNGFHIIEKEQTKKALGKL